MNNQFKEAIEGRNEVKKSLKWKIATQQAATPRKPVSASNVSGRGCVAFKLSAVGRFIDVLHEV